MNLLQPIANLLGGAGLLAAAIAFGRAYQMLRDLRTEVRENRTEMRELHARLDLLAEDLARLKAVFLGSEARRAR